MDNYKPYSYLWVDENLKLNNDILGNYFRRIVIGLNLLDLDSLKFKISANFGVQKSANCWRGNYVSGIDRVVFDFAQANNLKTLQISLKSKNLEQIFREKTKK